QRRRALGAAGAGSPHQARSTRDDVATELDRRLMRRRTLRIFRPRFHDRLVPAELLWLGKRLFEPDLEAVGTPAREAFDDDHLTVLRILAPPLLEFLELARRQCDEEAHLDLLYATRATGIIDDNR